VTTRVDPQGRPTVYDLLPGLDRFVFPVGRLDKDTSGLLILTDDHRLGETLTNPESHVPKTYEVVVDRVPDDAALESLRRGLDIGKGERTRPALVDLVRGAPVEIRLRLTIQEGKNRQVRRMLAAVGLSVLSLSRTAIGGFKLGDLPAGSHRSLALNERKRLLEGEP
jgi:pseudouridine synthase